MVLMCGTTHEGSTWICAMLRMGSGCPAGRLVATAAGGTLIAGCVAGLRLSTEAPVPACLACVCMACPFAPWQATSNPAVKSSSTLGGMAGGWLVGADTARVEEHPTGTRCMQLL